VRRPGDSLDVVPLERGRGRREAARVLVAGFLDDPAWVAIGPRARAHRRYVLRGFFGMTLREALRFGGPSWCATRGGRMVGVAVTFGDGRAFPPPHSNLVEAPPFVFAGAGPALRGARVGAVMERAHPHDPHLYLWFLAAHPDAQRQGVGRALMARVLEEAAAGEVPVYLETTRAENVPYYASFGFDVIGEEDLPRGAHMWFMSREAESAAARGTPPG
jgi:ribosomal protein S18 acetylase RimI-like enzyme